MSTPHPHTTSTSTSTSTNGTPAPIGSDRQRAVLSVFVAADRPVSASDVAKVLDQTLGAVAHHVRALARSGYIEWAGERRVRGALQTFYVPSEAGKEALRRPRVEALLELTGLLAELPKLGGMPVTAHDIDDRLVEDLDQVLGHLRPELHEIGRRWLQRLQSPSAAESDARGQEKRGRISRS